jgi:hypothetical protein
MTTTTRILSAAALAATALATTAFAWSAVYVPPEPIAPRVVQAAVYTPTSPIAPPIPVPGEPV